jgi:REP element-mobilizing transposase RayT
MIKSEYIHKSHNVSVLLYHFVCPAKYRRAVIDEGVDVTVKDICLEISKRYQIHFLEIGTDNDHVHFLLQSVPTYSATKIVTIIKSITAREVFKKHPEVKRQLWGGEFWTDGYFVNTVSRFGDENTISKYIQEQGREKEYKILQQVTQLALF